MPDWTPPPNPIADQAAARGEPVPLLSTAAELRAQGYEIPDRILDCAVLIVDSRSPTGYAWAIPNSSDFALAH